MDPDLMPLLILAIAVVGSLSVARVVRLLVADHYPPAEWLRNTWRDLTRHGGWSLLADCPFCMAPYVSAAAIVWAILAEPWDPYGAWSAAWWWWAINGWAALSYVAAMIVVRDEPPEE